MKTTVKMKALFFMIPLLVLMSLMFTYASVRTEKQIIRDEIIKRAETITTLATKTGELPILSGNPELLKSTASFLRANSEVASVTFYDARMTMLVHSGAQTSSRSPVLPANTPIYMSEEDDSFIFYAPVYTVRTQEDFDIFQEAGVARTVKERIGWIRLGFSKASMRENERNIVAQGLLMALIFATVSSILVYFLISLATRPLSRIVEVAHAIAHGDFNQETGINQRDEVGALADAFRSMKNAIRQVVQETNGLMLAVQAGNLDMRGNAEAFEGGWRELVTGVNDLTNEFAIVNRELTESTAAAEAASLAKSEFLANMSHELRTPLNAIMGYAQILKRQDNMTEAQRQQLETVRSSGEHLLMLINDILDVGKIEAQKMELEDLPFDLSALIRQVFNITKLHAEEKDIRFQYEAGTPLPEYVRGDERKLRQILLNLLSNAVKYTKRGSVTMRVSYGRVGAGLFRCEITDTGIGIPADKLEAVFEPFTQLVADRQVREGTGLGLNITKRLVELMQGELGVESTLGKGSTFWLQVALSPVAEIQDIPKSAEQLITGYQGERKRILIVDDNVTNTSMLVSLLAPLGFEVASAENGRVALVQAEVSRPDLVLLDLVMPEMDGLEMAREMRQHPSLAGTRIIGASATVSDSPHKELFASVCDDFIVKPLDIDLLLDKIRMHLQIVWETTQSRAAEAVFSKEAEESREQIEMPPAGELKELYDLGLLGDMRKIQAWAARLEERDAKYGPFADKLRELAGGFKTKAILALAKHPAGEEHDL
jgi:signal transduction histidine kinase/CheY-like chemotaxis protein